MSNMCFLVSVDLKEALPLPTIPFLVEARDWARLP